MASAENAFEQLCQLASSEMWCWKLGCTTCGCVHFRYSFRELSRGKCPNAESWEITHKITNYKDEFGDFPKGFLDQEKKKVLGICAAASLARISKECRFPDWLGYLGLVLYFMESDMVAFRTLSDSWAKQLMSLLPQEDSARDKLGAVLSGNALLALEDLEMCEHVLRRHPGD